jgi:4-hydroxybenzoate polyprenyltransferase
MPDDAMKPGRKFMAVLRGIRKTLAISFVVLVVVVILSYTLLPPEWSFIPVIIVSALLGAVIADLVRRDQAGPT